MVRCTTVLWFCVNVSRRSALNWQSFRTFVPDWKRPRKDESADVQKSLAAGRCGAGLGTSRESTAASPPSTAECRATMARCQCFARRINLIAAANVVATQFKKSLIDQGVFYCAWGCFSSFDSIVVTRTENTRSAPLALPLPRHSGLGAYTACTHKPVAGRRAVVHA